MSFESLGLSDFLLRALGELGYGAATRVQSEAIPPVLEGGDILAAAQTGSGKTAAFALPMLQRLSASTDQAQAPRFLVLVPTRELALQVGAAIEAYGKHLPIAARAGLVYGGVNIDKQIETFRTGVDIVVATPGRLIDLVEREAADLSQIQMLVLDEADRLLALGFAEELNKILAMLPSERQNLLFSATFPDAVAEMAEGLLKNPKRIQFKEESPTVQGITQRAIEVDPGARTALLRHLIKTEEWSRVMVFVATKRRASNLTAKLAKNGIRAMTLHGDLKQEQRTRALENFKKEKIQVLIATDLVARGIDIAKLPCVVNYDLPRSPTDYIHRIGRSARAGEVGTAVSFICQEDHRHFKLIEKRSKIRLERERIEGFEPSAWDPDSIPTPKAPVKGKGKNKKEKKRDAAAREARKAERAKRTTEGVETSNPPEQANASPDEIPVSSPWSQALKKAKQSE